MKITISGPAASGKGTVSRVIARHFGLMHFDAGLIFRYYAYVRYERGDEAALALINSSGDVWTYDWDGVKAIVREAGETLTGRLMGAEVSHLTSALATDAVHFHRMLKLCAHVLDRVPDVIVDGRSAGTLLVPHADFKFFLEAPLPLRAERRLADYRNMGLDHSYADVFAQLEERDRLDETRSIDPLRIPEGACVIHTGHLTKEGVCSKIIEHIQEGSRE
jgi:cytidylate kinase